MAIYGEHRSSERIERDIEKTRSQMAGTLDNIQRRFSSGQVVDQVLGYLDERSGRVGSEIVNTLKENPVPATLVGVGLVWLLAAGRSEAGTTEPSRRAYSPSRRKYGAVGGGSVAGAGGNHSGLGEASRPADETLETMEQKASEAAGQVRERTGQILGQAQEKAREFTGEARDQAERVGRKVREKARYVVEEQPLVLGALGIAVGAALGASLPRTRQEDEWLGETRDELVHRVDEVGGEWLREAREQVKSGVESATSGQQTSEPEVPEKVPETERAETSPITTGSSSGAILAELERERQHGTAATAGLESSGGGSAEATAAGTTGLSERIPTTPEGGGESQRS